MPIIDGRLLPPWVFVVGGIWILVLVGLIVAWLFPDRPANPNQTPTPPGGGQRTRRPPKKYYGGGALLWLLTGAILLQFHNLMPGPLGEVCGVDQFPDWVVVSIVPKTNDDIVFTIKNIGPCPAPKVAAVWNWGKSTVSNPYASCLTVEGKAPGVDPTPLPSVGAEGGSPFSILAFMKLVPPLATGESTTSSINVPLGYWYLTHGEAKVGLQVNCPRNYKEENYYNDVGVYP